MRLRIRREYGHWLVTGRARNGAHGEATSDSLLWALRQIITGLRKARRA